MARPVISPDRSLSEPGSVSRVNAIASHGTALPAAIKTHVERVNTSVPCAAHLPTMPNSATSSPNLLIINTPFFPDEWDKMLNKLTPFNKFSDVPIGMRFGFDMGVNLPPTSTYTPPNHNSALLYPNHVMSHIHNELSLRRYSGPFSRSRLELLISPFQSSPLGTVPKSLDSTECRIIQDLSFPRNDPTRSSVNVQIDIENFRCDWGTFNDVRSIVIDAPAGSEADVDSAFRCCPILPSQQSSFIVHWNNLYYIDHNAPFGATSSGGIFGRIADAKSAILTSKGLGPAKNWVDDFVFFRFPIVSNSIPLLFSYSLSDIYKLATTLGWPWKESKTRPFSHEFKYLGFVWDLSTKTVQIPTDKKTRYLAKLEPWTEGQKFSKKEVESTLGTLVHCSLAVPDGRSHLPSFSRFAASFKFLSSPFIRRPLSSGVLTDVSWWR